MKVCPHAGTAYGLGLVELAEQSNRDNYRASAARVYCLRSPGFFKVGMSVGIAQRIQQLQASIPYTLILLYEGDGGRATENAIHRYLSRHHCRGEWFEDNDESRALVWKAFSSLPNFKSYTREAASA